MLNIFSKVIAATLVAISFFFISKFFLSDTERFFSYKRITSVVLFAVAMILISSVDYYPFYSLLMLAILIIFHKIIFQIDLPKAVITVVIVYIIYFISDIIVGISVSSIFGSVLMRENSYIFIISNFLVSFLAIVISRIPKFKSLINMFISKLETNKYYNNVLFFILIFVVLSLILYNISEAAKFSKSYLIDVIVMFVFCITAFIFIKERNERNKLNDEYDKLIEYIESFENWIDDEQFNNHEYKNQLAVIRTLAKRNKKVVAYINEILKEDIYVEDFWANEIKSLPSGGFKGLLYYKLLCTKKENIDICLSVGRDVKNYIAKINGREMKKILQVMGIFLDNAIDAAKTSKNKILSVEVYCINSKLVIVISNTYSGEFDFNKLMKKGYTTKGKGHGRGLYFADKIIRSSSILESSRNLINNYYVQKIVVNK